MDWLILSVLILVVLALGGIAVALGAALTRIEEALMSLRTGQSGVGAHLAALDETMSKAFAPPNDGPDLAARLSVPAGRRLLLERLAHRLKQRHGD